MEVVNIGDAKTGAEASILVGFGFNCFRFKAVFDSGPVEVLWAADGFKSGGGRPSGSGIPLLFPFPGRIAGTTMHWRGTDYQLNEADVLGNAIHGFVHERPWRVVDVSDSHVTGEFQASVDDASLLEKWPADFRIRATYRLSGNSLQSRFEIDNPGDADLPFGFGTHPYFRLPLGAGDANACQVTVPVSQRWLLDGMIASGQTTELDATCDLAAGMTFADMQLDAGFSGLAFDDDGKCAGRIEDAANGRSLEIQFGRAFRECVVYCPPHRQAVCIEPYTCICDPFRLDREGIDAGLRVLAPGESLNAEVDLVIK